ncbi:LSm family protein [Marinobacter fonticola]|uniref:acetylornithine deacetylase n=1 Tax=Marinobacter fonticola TaxID=2603215 RepID=UPI0011E6FAE6|nr:acetylornithine deacetylase [Marinobacter fonticola]
MKKLFLSLIGILLLGYMGFKGVAWYQVNEALKRAQKVVEDEGVLSWGGIGSSLSGQVSVYDLQYQHFSLTQSIQAGRLTFSTAAAPELLDAISGGPLPGEWQLQVEHLHMALATPLIRDWVAPRNSAVQAGLVNIPCGNSALDIAALMQLGVTQVAMDLQLEQSAMLDDTGGLGLEVNAGKLGSLELRAPGLRLDTFGDDAEGFDEYGGSVALVARDGGFMRRVAAFCARESGLEIDAWAAQATRVFSERLVAQGFSPSDQLRALYKVWLRDGGELNATLTAGDPLFGLPQRDVPGEVVPLDPGVGNFDVFYNGAQVPDLFVRYLPRSEPVSPVTSTAFERSSDNGGDSLRYVKANPDEARRWLGKNVRVALSSGRVVEGRLSGVDDRRLEVTRIVDGGEVAYPLANSAITLFEVWRRPGDKGLELPSRPVAEPAPDDVQETAPETQTELPDAISDDTPPAVQSSP